MKDTRKPAKGAAAIAKASKASKAFSEEELDAIKERTEEVKAAGRKRGAGKADGESEVLAKIAEMQEPERTMAGRIHAIVKASAPELLPKTWYGMPAYMRDGKVVCFFQSATKFKTRYATLGFSDQAKLDDGNMWPNAFALVALTAADEARISELVRRAVG